MSGANLAHPAPDGNPGEQPGPVLHPTTLDRAEAMLDYLRKLPPAVGHEEARAAIAASAQYLCEVFGQQHALATTASIAAPILNPLGFAPAEVAPVEAPAVTLH